MEQETFMWIPIASPKKILPPTKIVLMSVQIPNTIKPDDNEWNGLCFEPIVFFIFTSPKERKKGVATQKVNISNGSFKEHP